LDSILSFEIYGRQKANPRIEFRFESFFLNLFFFFKIKSDKELTIFSPGYFFPRELFPGNFFLANSFQGNFSRELFPIEAKRRGKFLQGNFSTATFPVNVLAFASQGTFSLGNSFHGIFSRELIPRELNFKRNRL
jgi:hypothetical protein